MNNGICCISVIDNQSNREVASIWCKRPCWEGVHFNYSNAPNDDALFLKSIGHHGRDFTTEEISAVRVTVAIIGSKAMKEALDKETENPQAVGIIKEGNLKGYKFIKGVNELKEWLSKKAIWGDPEEATLADAGDIVNGRNGVLIILGKRDNEVRGYATLWRGSGNSVIERGRQRADSNDRIYFWELKEVGVNMRAGKLLRPIVIDRYKMPGLNDTGTDIAEDMCYGLGGGTASRIYPKNVVERYIAEYQMGGFQRGKHKTFSNQCGSPSKSIYSKNDIPQLVTAAKEALKILAVPARKLHMLFQLVIDLVEDNEIAERRRDKRMFAAFREMVNLLFAHGNMNKNINEMIDKFQNNEGGIYENQELTDFIAVHPSTMRYCKGHGENKGLENYIKKKLKIHNGDANKLEDKEVDWKKKDVDNEEKCLSRATRNARNRKKGKDFDLTPAYNPISLTPKKLLNIEKLKNTFGGATIALNDIWATEVIITEYELNGREYTVKYQVTLGPLWIGC